MAKTTTKFDRDLRELQKAQKAQQKRENTNWNAKYYRDKIMQSRATASFEQAHMSEAVIVSVPKREIKAAWKAAEKVRGNRKREMIPVPKYVMVGGIPHTMRDGKLVPLKAVGSTPAKRK